MAESTIHRLRFEASLLRPAQPPRATWCFLILPAEVSAMLSTRGLVAVAGSLAGQPFQATLQPDGQGGHWLKVNRALREAAGVAIGDCVMLDVVPSDDVPEPKLPAELRQALAAHVSAHTQWKTLTPTARRDWIHWIESAKKPETRARRIVASCDMLAGGKRRVCCFDRSGIYSKALAAPIAASSP